MNTFVTLASLLAVLGLTAAGHFYPEHDHHGKGIEVHYSVVTEHKEDSHGHAYGGHGHDSGHAEVHSWGHDNGHIGEHDAGHMRWSRSRWSC